MLIITFLIIIGFSNLYAKITIDANFENGYIGKYQIVEPDIIKIGPLNGNKETWFSFRILGVKRIKVNFIFEWINKGEVYAPNYNGTINNKAMVSYDGKGYEIIKDVFTKSFLNSDKPAIRRHEDIMQDGELIVRSFAEYFGIESKDCPPFLMAGDCNTNNGKKGDKIIFSVYYYDINELPPKHVTLVVGDKKYEMTAAKSDNNYRKPVLYHIILF